MVEKWEPFKDTPEKTAYNLVEGFYYYEVTAGSGRIDINGVIESFSGKRSIEIAPNLHHIFYADTDVKFIEYRHPVSE